MEKGRLKERLSLKQRAMIAAGASVLSVLPISSAHAQEVRSIVHVVQETAVAQHQQTQEEGSGFRKAAILGFRILHVDGPQFRDPGIGCYTPTPVDAALCENLGYRYIRVPSGRVKIIRPGGRIFSIFNVGIDVAGVLQHEIEGKNAQKPQAPTPQVSGGQPTQQGTTDSHTSPRSASLDDTLNMVEEIASERMLNMKPGQTESGTTDDGTRYTIAAHKPEGRTVHHPSTNQAYPAQVVYDLSITPHGTNMVINETWGAGKDSKGLFLSSEVEKR